MTDNKNTMQQPSQRPVRAPGQVPQSQAQSGRATRTGGQRAESVRQSSTASMKRPTDVGAGQAKKRTVLLVLGCVIVALAVWLLVWFFACNGSGLFDPNAQTGQAPYKTDEEMQAELNRQVEEGMFNISIASVIQFDDGTSPGTAYIENVPSNRYLMQVAITDDASGDVLYESGVLQPNQHIEQIALAKDLDPGTYAGTATFTALDATTYDEIGQAAAKVTLNVLG